MFNNTTTFGNMTFNNTTIFGNMTGNMTLIYRSCRVDPSSVNIVYTVFMVSLLLLSVIGNSVVLFAVLLSNKLTKRKSSTFYFVASLGNKVSYDVNF